MSDTEKEHSDLVPIDLKQLELGENCFPFTNPITGEKGLVLQREVIEEDGNNNFVLSTMIIDDDKKVLKGARYTNIDDIRYIVQELQGDMAMAAARILKGAAFTIMGVGNTESTNKGGE